MTGVRLAAYLTGAMGLLNILSAVLPAERVHLPRGWPLEVSQSAHTASALAGFCLLMLARSLAMRKRMAWRLTVALLLVSFVSYWVNHLPAKANLAGLLALWLVWMRPQFHARSDQPYAWQGVAVLLASITFTLVYGVLGLAFAEHHHHHQFDLSKAFNDTLKTFFQDPDAVMPHQSPAARLFADSISTIGALTVGYSLYLLLRPVFLRLPATPEERQRARAIVDAHGRSTMARFTLFDDKSYFFSPGGSLVAFVQKGTTALALGDPIGPATDFAACLQAFEAHCTGLGWKPAFYQTLPDHLEGYKAAGYDVLAVGHEGVVELAGFAPSKSLKSTCNKLAKKGFTAEILQPRLDPALVAELRAISDEWLSMMNGSEKRFSLGWFDAEYVASGPVIVVRTPEGKVSAFANLIREFQKNELTIDLMRRRAEVESGTMDFLFVSLLEWAKAQGFETFNLGLSPLAGVGEKEDDPVPDRTLHFLYEHLNKFYNFKGLHQFKEKFKPRWEPRYLIYPGLARLPKVALALVRADSGDDFLASYWAAWRSKR